MLRWVLWAVWSAISVIAIVGLFGGGLVGRIGDVGPLSTLLSLALTQTVFFAFLLGTHFAPPSRLLKVVMRRALRKVERAQKSHQARRTRDFIEALIEAIVASPAQTTTDAGAVLANAVKRAEPASGTWPWELPNVDNWLELSVRAVEDSLLLRILVPERTKSVAELLANVAKAWSGYDAKRPVPLAELTRTPNEEPEQLFADYASALTGAIVLADTSQTRSGMASGLQVWHSSAYSPQSSPDTTPDFDQLHGARADGAVCGWSTKLRAQRGTRVGDFDGRVLNVEAVALTQDQRSGSVEFILRTTETCYAATDLSEGACKGNVSDESWDAPWCLDTTTMLAVRTGTRRRLNMLTVIAAIILEHRIDGTARSSLLVSRRSRTLRHGSAVHSMVGGVMNHTMGSRRGDVDDLGIPDPRSAIAREIEEELGLSIPAHRISPVAVYMFNQRDPSTEGSDHRQLLTTVSFSTHVDQTLEQVKATRAVAAAVGGRYELDELTEIVLPRIDYREPDRQVARNNAATEFAHSVHALADELDQAAMVSAVYACAEAYGPHATRHAFDKAFPLPWPEVAWSSILHTEDTTNPRTARDPRSQITSPR